jgi:hypothetical protein
MKFSFDEFILPVPHRCPACMGPDACGFNGQLVLPVDFGKPPVCDHNEKPGRQCHPEPITMIASSLRRRGTARKYSLT